MQKKIIKVLIVEDSPVVTLILKRIFGSSPEIEVVGTAQNGLEGLELIPQVQPDVICTDLHMARMNGLEFTREVMCKYPRPILVISASVQADDTSNVFQLLDAGAVDVFPKPRSYSVQDYEFLKQELIGKIKVLSGVAVFTMRRRNKISGGNLPPAGEGKLANYPKNSSSAPSKTVGSGLVDKIGVKATTELNSVSAQKRKSSASSFPIPHSPLSHAQVGNTVPNPKFKIVVIGASTGGPQSLQAILSQLPSNFPVPIICVQHISEGFLQGLVDWLGSESKLAVKIAKMGDLPQAGTIYFPPEGRHLELNSQGRFVYSSLPPVSGHRPSVTVTFNSVAKFYGSLSLAILLTGMGRDGADGMLTIAQAGGVTIAQDEATCVVFGMPKEAIALGAAKFIMPIHDIAPYLLAQAMVKI